MPGFAEVRREFCGSSAFWAQRISSHLRSHVDRRHVSDLARSTWSAAFRSLRSGKSALTAAADLAQSAGRAAIGLCASRAGRLGGDQRQRWRTGRRRDALRSSASARPHEIEDADQVSVIVDCEHDEPEVAEVRDPPSRYPGRRAEHRIGRVIADPGKQLTSMSNPCSCRPLICWSALGSRYGRVVHALERRPRM